MAKILLFTPTFRFKNLHRHKDVGIIIENFNKYFGYETYILTKKNETEYKNYNSKIIFITNELLGFIKNIFSIKPDVLIMFHPTIKTIIYSLLYKIINFRGKIYIKSDTHLQNLKYYKNGKISLIYILFIKFFSLFSVISFENKNDVILLKNKYKLNIIHIPNGIDISSGIDFNNNIKENIITTVGRLGTYQKNTQELLEILKILLNNDITLKAVLIGDIQDETNFKDFLEKYLIENKNIKDRILFSGNIPQEKVFDFYKKSRFFILTSRFEGFACSLAEASFFGDIIISRNVGGVNDITNNGKFGLIYTKFDEIIDFVNNGYLKIDMNDYQNYIKENYTYEKILYNLNSILLGK